MHPKTKDKNNGANARKGETDTMKDIILKEAATITANGELNSRNCKSVCRIDKFGVVTFYTSVTDAARDNGIFPQNMSRILIHSGNFKGNVFCYVKDLYKYLGCIAERSQGISTMAEKAKAYDAMLAEQEAARKAKEKEAEAREKAITKAKEKLERRKAIYARKETELDEAYQHVKEAERELNTLNGNDKKLSLVPYEIIPKDDGGYELTINGIGCGWVPNIEIANKCIDYFMSHKGKEEDK